MQRPPKHDQPAHPASPVGAAPAVGVALIDRELRFVEVDETMAAMHGWPAAEHVGRSVAEVCPALAPTVEPLLRHVLSSGEYLRDVELRGEGAAGRPGRWLVSYEPVRARSGTVLAVECLVRELEPAAPEVALAAAHEALRQAAEQLAFQARILEQLNDAVVAVDSRGMITYWGPGATRLFGLPADSAAGRSVWELLRPSWPPGENADAARAALSSGEQWRGEVTLHTQDGGAVAAAVSARAFADRDRTAVNYLVVIQDVSERRRAEQKAAESQRLFQRITEASPDLIYIYDRQASRNVYANREVVTILGYTPDEVQARGSGFVLSLFHPEDLAGTMAFAERVAAAPAGEVQAHEYRMRHADGSYRWLYSRELVLTRTSDGAVALTLGIAQDVTARRAADEERAALLAREQAALHQSDEARVLLDTLIGSAPIGFSFVDRELRFVLVNQALAANNGLPVAAHVGRTVREVLPALADTVEPLLRYVIEHGEPLIDLEVTGETPSQPAVQRIWRESLYPVRGPGGEVVGVGAIVAEITEHRRSSEERAQLLARAEAAAARTASLQAITAALAPALTPERVNRAIVEEAVQVLGARSGILVLLDASGETLEVVCQVGYELPELRGARWPLTLNEPLPDAVRQSTPILVNDRAEAERLYPEMAAVRELTADVAWANLPLIGEGRVQGALSLGFSEPQPFGPDDKAMLAAVAQQCAQALLRARLYAAEREAREAAEQAVRERDELVALISHDLKNPLTVIQGQAQLLERRLARDGGLDLERLAWGVSAIHQAAGAMSNQIEELLDVAMIRAGRPLRLYKQPIDLVAVAGRAVSLAQANSDRHRVQLLALEPELIAVVDGPRLERVLANLLSNALKYSAGGEISVAVRREEAEGRAWALLSVADHGVGIPAADQSRIFEGFHRASNIAGTVKGTGLGLVSVARIVAQHGGTIGLHSVEGQGSVFTVRLPLEQ